MESSDSSITQNLGFEIVVALEEDIGAELDYFVFLTLLRLDDEASDFAKTALWQHLHHFPVTAEIASFLIRRYDTKSLKLLWENLHDQHIRFANVEENLLLHHIEQIATDRSAAAQKWYHDVVETVKIYDEMSQVSVSKDQIHRLRHMNRNEHHIPAQSHKIVPSQLLVLLCWHVC